MPLRNLQPLVPNSGAQTARDSDIPGCGRAGGRGRSREPLPGQRPPPSVHTPTAECPRRQAGRPDSQGNVHPAPRGRVRDPFRGLKHNALELQLPQRPARFPRVGTTATPEAAGKRPRDRSRLARATVPLETQVRRPPETVSDFARHLSRPQRRDLRSPRSGGPTARPRASGPRSRRLAAALTAAAAAVTAAVSARATTTAAAHFRFPSAARAATAARESPQASAPPGPARPRPAPPLPEGSLAATLRARAGT